MKAYNTIHWLGAGLSSAPGITFLAEKNRPIIVWNRSLEKAEKLLKGSGVTIDIRHLDWHQLAQQVKPGDIIVSMLPATFHVEIAEFCIRNKAHFVSSSYISEQMAALSEQAKLEKLCLVNEVGLDPGLDHLFAHLLVDEYINSNQFSSSVQYYFRSYCGGFPKVANDFKYKFSWSPLGVLKALKSPAQWKENGQVKHSAAPWHALCEYEAQLPHGQETFQAYPNRNSIPFLKQYNFGENWDVQQFVRGTLRLNGWSKAWRAIFDQLDELNSANAEARLTMLSKNLEEKYSYLEGEADRVVMNVELEVRNDNKAIWHKSYCLDSSGNNKGQAMARLVSIPVSFAVESILDGLTPFGVSAAPEQPKQVYHWLARLKSLGEQVGYFDHLK